MHSQSSGPRRQNDGVPGRGRQTLIPWSSVVGSEEGLEAESHRVVRVEDVEQPSTPFSGFGERTRAKESEVRRHMSVGKEQVEEGLRERTLASE